MIVKGFVAKLTSPPAPLLPLTAKLTLFNCATLTASVSLVPAARLVIWRVFVLLPIDTAPVLAVNARPVKPAYLSVRLVLALYPAILPAVVASEYEPNATPLYTLALELEPRAIAFSADALALIPIEVADVALPSAPLPIAITLFTDLLAVLPLTRASVPSRIDSEV